MDESEFNQLAGKAFKRLVAALDQVDPDLLDTESTGDMVTVTARGGEKCIINTQRAARQLWVAGLGQGVHFSYDAARGQWWDDKGKGLELFAFVRQVLASIGGVDVSF